jgi:prevent-host-death family protein
MCYMATRATGTSLDARVGVRELRQNLSVYLERVVAGEALQVTDRGRAVAMLVPLPQASTTVERLVAAGRATPPKGDPRAVRPPKGRATRTLSRALMWARRDRF